MHVVMRSYPTTELANTIMANKAEVEKVIRQVPGFVSWTLIRTGDTCMTATICQDKSGCDRSLEVAREWVSKRLPNMAQPQVHEGEVLIRMT